jgi:acetyl esterase/lipase
MNRLVEDPRIDPRIKAAFGDLPVASVAVDSRDALVAMLAAAAKRPRSGPPSLVERLAASDYEEIAPSGGLSIRTEQIVSSPDGNRINLQIITPPGPGPWPCVYYIHGGGMMMMSCYDANYRAWGRLIARQGVAVAMVDFRNSLAPSSAPEVAPYPAGLNDCASGLAWVRANGAALNIDPQRIIVAGESGGGNLSLALALKLKREGALGDLSGVYLMCPYLAGEWPGAEGSSALENAGLIMDLRSDYGAVAYGVEALRNKDPLAWPGFATEADLAGLPPIVINVNECDPLRDDGVDLYRKLLRAGVPARCRQLTGTVHGTEVFLCCPDVSRDVARDLAAFCAEGGRIA